MSTNIVPLPAGTKLLAETHYRKPDDAGQYLDVITIPSNSYIYVINAVAKVSSTAFTVPKGELTLQVLDANHGQVFETLDTQLVLGANAEVIGVAWYAPPGYALALEQGRTVAAQFANGDLNTFLSSVAVYAYAGGR